MPAPQKPTRSATTWLRRADQPAVAALVALALGAIAWHWYATGGHRGERIEIDRAPPVEAKFLVDMNEADWPEFAQLPGVGETLGRRIVQSREADGPFVDVDDLRRVRGIGPLTVQRLRPFILPVPPAGATVAR